MAHLPASALIFKHLLSSFVIGTVGLPSPTAAHEVFASTVTVSRDRNNVEILQTSPIGALKNLNSLLEEDIGETPSALESLLKNLS